MNNIIINNVEYKPLKLSDDERKEKIKMLCEKFKVTEYMGELFLNEIKLSTDEANKPHREIAKLLGLM